MFWPHSNIPFRRVCALPGILPAAALLAACSAAPVKMECRELQMRIDYGDLSNDQLRFALQEMEDCKRRLRAAEAKDSASLESAERSFTPEAPLSPKDRASAYDSLPPAAAPAPTDTSGARP